jgi:DNA-3-methyladenine glycosylase
MIRPAPLPREFYAPSAETVAPRLLGHLLVRRTPSGSCSGIIVETEAYLVGDAACHGAPGPTARNQVMFGESGHAYVYLIYGLHYCVNAVCRPPGTAEAVLIRAVEPLDGLPLMQRHRGPQAKPQLLTNGPARLCQALAIDRTLDGVDLCDPESELLIAENPSAAGFRCEHGPVITTTRVGITKAAELPLRFYLKRNRFISRPGRSYF